jgi:tRNA nucleotidyltransferase (CCA-adding enzyme)
METDRLLNFPHLPWRGPCNQQKNDKKNKLVCAGRFREFAIPAKIPPAMEIITTHLEADFDGIASMVAAHKLYPEAHLVLPGGAQSRERAYLAQHPLPLTSITNLAISDISRIILVDADHQDRLGPLEKALKNQPVSIHIWDHHPLESTNPLAKRAEFLRLESVGATITLLVETLQEQSLSWSPEEATLFAIALYEETGHFTYLHTTPRDLQVGARLIETGANLTVVTDVIQRKWTEPQAALFNALLQTTELLTLGLRKVALTTLAWPEYVADLAPVTQQLGQIYNADAVLTAVAMEGKIQIVGRSRHTDMNMNKIAQAFGGAGHTMAAAASIKGLTLAEVDQRLHELLQEQAKTWLPIRRLMTTPVRTVEQGTPIKQTERLMTQYEVNALPVVNTHGQFIGLATREAIQKGLYHKLTSQPVEHIMLRDIFLANPDTPFEDVQLQMVERNQRIVPILDHETVIGIFSRTDLLRAMHQGPGQGTTQETISGVAPTIPTPSSSTPLHTWNVKHLLTKQLPSPLLSLLEKVEQLADRLDVSAFLVGGFVRDLLLGIANFDLDFVIEGDGIQFGKMLAKELSAEWTTHERFGTVSIQLPQALNLPHMHHLDVATARTEYYEYPTALPTVERSSIKKDLYRRDFTINALAIRINRTPGELLDYFGGRRDLKDKVIRVLHSLSFVEDPTRVFRAIRFEQRFGFRISKETEQFIQQAQTMELFQRLSGSRLGNELIHMLEEPDPAKGIRRLEEFRLMPFIHPQLHTKSAVQKTFASVEKIFVWFTVEHPDTPMKRWLAYGLAWFESLGNTELTKTWKRLGFPQGHIKTVGNYVLAQSTLIRTLNRQNLASSEAYALLSSWPNEILVFLMAKVQLKPATQRAMERVREYFTTWQHISIALTGHDLEDMGLPKGPAYRRVLDTIFKSKLDGMVATAEDEYRLAKTLIEQETRLSKSKRS